MQNGRSFLIGMVVKHITGASVAIRHQRSFVTAALGKIRVFIVSDLAGIFVFTSAMLKVQIAEEGCEAFTQPEMAPVLRTYQVTKPLVGQFVRTNSGKVAISLSSFSQIG